MNSRAGQHELDDDACCIHCGFDGAEWWHLERHKPKSEREPEPPCTARQVEVDEWADCTIADGECYAGLKCRTCPKAKALDAGGVE